MRALATLVACAFVVACEDDVTVQPRTVRLHVTGTVTATATGAPIPDARVDLWRSFIGSGYVVATATRDASGVYTLRLDALCSEGSTDHGYILVAAAPGYEQQSHVNIGATMRCTTAPQRVDFVLRSQGSRRSH